VIGTGRARDRERALAFGAHAYLNLQAASPKAEGNHQRLAIAFRPGGHRAGERMSDVPAHAGALRRWSLTTAGG
jgi:hypothetical protein